MPAIEKNRPLPRDRATKGELVETMRAMAPGDSFKVPSEWHLPSVRAQAYSMPGAKFTIRKDADGYRCWRKA